MHISELFSKETHNQIKQGNIKEFDVSIPSDLIIKINEILFESEIERFPIKLIVPLTHKNWKENIAMEEINENDNYTAVNIFLNTKQTKKTISFNNFGIEIYNSTILIYGKYLKYRRDIYQTYHRGVIGIDTFLKVLKNFYNSDNLIFSGLGREDIDVMNLTGRDFILKVVNPKKNIYAKNPLNKYPFEELRENLVAFYNLKVVDSRIETIFKSNPLKEYRCLIIARLNKPIEVELKEQFYTIKQQTPLRVLHRRADLIRTKQVYITKFEICKSNVNNSLRNCFSERDSKILDVILNDDNILSKEDEIDFSKFEDYSKPDEYFFSVQDSKQRELIDKIKLEIQNICECIPVIKPEDEYCCYLNVNLVASSGAYIKEFVHGDFGRTQVSLKDILKDIGYKEIELEMVFLDVLRLIY